MTKDEVIKKLRKKVAALLAENRQLERSLATLDQLLKTKGRPC